MNVRNNGKAPANDNATPFELDDDPETLFLKWLERDMAAHPEQLIPLDAEDFAALEREFADEIAAIDLDAPIDGEPAF